MEVFTRTTVPYLWTVPKGVTCIKVTVIGGSGGTGTGGTSSFGTYVTATGGTSTASGSASGHTLKYISMYAYGSGAGGDGGVGVDYLENVLPGTPIRITVGAAGATGVQGAVIVEY